MKREPTTKTTTERGRPMTLTEVGRVLNMNASDVLYHERKALRLLLIALQNDPVVLGFLEGTKDSTTENER